MTETVRTSTSLLSEAVRSAVRASTLDDSAVALVQVLGPAFSLWRLSVLIFSPDAGHYLIAAAWSAGDTVLAPGTDIAMDLTPAVRRTIDTLRSGKPIALRLREMDFGLLGDVIRDEGLASWLGVPLRNGDQVVGALSLASSSPSAFDDADLLFFEGIAAGVEGRIIELASGSVA